jgi:sirohydrochlorin ferrochelatase
VDAILLVDHGSRRADANATLDAIAELVRARTDALVAVAHLELASPSIEEAITAIGDRVRDLVVVPYFLAPGRHVSEDVPRRVREAARAFPSMRVRIAEPLGVDPLLAELVLARAR